MKQIPFLLIYSRIVIAALIIVLPFIQLKGLDIYLLILFITGFLTDVFDGIIARKLGVSSEKLRIWDSNADLVFWIATVSAVFFIKYEIIKPLFPLLIVLFSLELITYLVSYLKFKKTVATHAILSKIWTISIVVFLGELLLNSTTVSFYICFWLGAISRFEILLILIGLKNWTTDVPSIFSVRKLNKGEKIRKNKLFNS